MTNSADGVTRPVAALGVGRRCPGPGSARGTAVRRPPARTRRCAARSARCRRAAVTSLVTSSGVKTRPRSAARRCPARRRTPCRRRRDPAVRRVAVADGVAERGPGGRSTGWGRSGGPATQAGRGRPGRVRRRELDGPSRGQRHPSRAAVGEGRFAMARAPTQLDHPEAAGARSRGARQPFTGSQGSGDHGRRVPYEADRRGRGTGGRGEGGVDELVRRAGHEGRTSEGGVGSVAISSSGRSKARVAVTPPPR